MRETPFDQLRGTLPCYCYSDQPDGCVCSDCERALPHYHRRQKGKRLDLPPMPSAQRAWCLSEVRSVEGMGAEAQELEREGTEDRWFACYVIDAWVEYCRDKGLI